MNSSNDFFPTALRFERIALKHLPDLMEIEVEAYQEPWTLNMFRQEVFNGSSHFHVALLGDEVAGYVGFWLVLDEAHITSVTIRDTMRGRGLGRQLMEFIMDAAKAVGATRASLEVRVTNHRAQNLYRSMGFREVYVRKGYYAKNREDALVMMADLGDPPAESTSDPAPPVSFV